MSNAANFGIADMEIKLSREKNIRRYCVHVLLAKGIYAKRTTDAHEPVMMPRKWTGCPRPACAMCVAQQPTTRTHVSSAVKEPHPFAGLEVESSQRCPALKSIFIIRLLVYRRNDWCRSNNRKLRSRVVSEKLVKSMFRHADGIH